MPWAENNQAKHAAYMRNWRKTHQPPLQFCARCDHKIDAQSGWGILTFFCIQEQPEGDRTGPRSHALQMCGYCFNGLAKWLCPDEAR